MEGRDRTGRPGHILRRALVTRGKRNSICPSKHILRVRRTTIGNGDGNNVSFRSRVNGKAFLMIVVKTLRSEGGCGIDCILRAQQYVQRCGGTCRRWVRVDRDSPMVSWAEVNRGDTERRA